MAWHGAARRGEACSGEARSGKVWLGEGSFDGLILIEAWPGGARHVLVRLGLARQGLVRHGVVR